MDKVRYISDKFGTSMELVLWEDHVAMLLFSKENPLTIHIKSKEIHDNFQNYFDLMWQISKE